MPVFQFNALDAKGGRIKGQRTASSPEDLANQLQSESLTPIDISLATSKQSAKPRASQEPSLKRHFKTALFKHKVSQEELQMFCRQMHTVLKSGLPIGVAVGRLAETTRDKVLANALQQVMQNLNQGRSLYLSLKQFPDVFSDFFINLVKVGESTGKLDEVFMHLSDYLELETDTKKKIKTALRYPILVLVAMFVALLVINAFVIPAFAQMFKQFKGELPFMTRLLMVTSDFIIHQWYVVAIILGLLFFTTRTYLRSAKGAFMWAKWQLKMPVVGWLVHRIILARFARLYALVLRAGLTAVDGLDLVGASSGNVYMADKIKLVSKLVARGNSISSSIGQSNLFPPLMLQMVTLGEETGNIDSLLDDVAEFYQREITYDLVRLSDAIEPIMLVIMGGMVLVLALGVFMPMWDMASQVGQK